MEGAGYHRADFERCVMHYVAEASYVSDYKIKVRFENDEVKLVDLEPHLDEPIFRPLKDISYFRSFTVNADIDTVVWPNNADFSPEFLYEIGQSISMHLDPADGLESARR
jgi:hypothetical protein